MSRPLLLPALLCLALPCLAAERVALVIGNGAYKDAKLPNPMNDAQLVAASLRKTGFKVIEKTDLTRDGMRAAIREFSDALGKGDTALFYYAGHGAQVRDENYLLPVDAPMGMKEFEAEDRSVKINLALAAMEECGSALNIVILDCCRDNPFARSWRSATRGLAEMKAPQETLIAYATAPGKAASDGAGSNSPYSQALAEEILRPGVKLQDVFLNVARRVHAATEGEQRPWTASDLLGEFVFVAAKPSAAPPPQAPPVVPTTLPMPSGPAIYADTIYGLDDIFDGTRYDSFDSYSRGAVLRKAQEKLKAAGLYKSSVDGKSGSGTCAAIREWQAQHGILASGALTTETLATLGLDKEVASKSPEKLKSFTGIIANTPRALPEPAPASNGGQSFGIPISGKRGFVYSPHDRSAGPVDVRDYPSGTKVRCPYTGKIFYVP